RSIVSAPQARQPARALSYRQMAQPPLNPLLASACISQANTHPARSIIRTATEFCCSHIVVIFDAPVHDVTGRTSQGAPRASAPTQAALPQHHDLPSCNDCVIETS